MKAMAFMQLPRVFIFTSLIGMILCFSNMAISSPIAPLTPAASSFLVGLRQAGLHGDQSQIPAMIVALNTEHDSYIITALRALSQLGATEALPEIDKIIQKRSSDYVGRYAEEAKLRLLAEASVKPATLSVATQKPNVSQDNLAAKIDYILAQTDVPAPEINKRLNRAKIEEKHTGSSKETDLLGNIADIAYNNAAEDGTTPVSLQELDFSSDRGAEFKIRLARMPAAKRIPWIIDTLARRDSHGSDDDLLIQLAADAGPSASAQAASCLQEMLAHRENYKYGGFANLFDVICCAGDKKSAEAIALFLNDSDVYVANIARIDYQKTISGERVQYAIGY